MGIFELGKWGWRMWAPVYSLWVMKIRVLLYAVLRTQLIFRLNVYKVLLAASYREHNAHIAWFKAFEINDGWKCFREQNWICVQLVTIGFSDCSKTLLLSPHCGNVVQPDLINTRQTLMMRISYVAAGAFPLLGLRYSADFLGVYLWEVGLWFLQVYIWGSWSFFYFYTEESQSIVLL